MSKKRLLKMPHIYVILFILIALAAVATYIVPAGEYERVPGPEGRTTIDLTSYASVEQTPVGITDFLTVIPRGLIDAGEVIFFTFIIGGMFMVLRHTGIIEIVVDKLSGRFSGKSFMLIPILVTVICNHRNPYRHPGIVACLYTCYSATYDSTRI